MDTQRDARLLASQDLPEDLEHSGSLAEEPGLQEPTEDVVVRSMPSVQAFVPGLPADPPFSALATGGVPTPPIPEVGEEIAALGQELGTALVQRRTAERRSIFAQRGRRGPDDSPFSSHIFDDTKEYRRAAWGSPVPQEEWERRVYVELSLATDPRDEGKGAPPRCHACHVRGGKAMPLAKCILCDNWACLRHLAVPACLARAYPVCAAHPGLEYRPQADYSCLCKHW
eukprot:6490450-Amphidinium_carterae.3